ncbi:MAG: hypothetical protein ACQERJ_10240, partial [Bacillota bacterium]
IDVRCQFNREIDRISKLALNEIEEQYGEEIYNLFLLSETDGYKEHMMNYFKLNTNRNHFNFKNRDY